MSNKLPQNNLVSFEVLLVYNGLKRNWMERQIYCRRINNQQQKMHWQNKSSLIFVYIDDTYILKCDTSKTRLQSTTLGVSGNKTIASALSSSDTVFSSARTITMSSSGFIPLQSGIWTMMPFFGCWPELDKYHVLVLRYYFTILIVYVCDTSVMRRKSEKKVLVRLV